MNDAAYHGVSVQRRISLFRTPSIRRMFNWFKEPKLFFPLPASPTVSNFVS